MSAPVTVSSSSAAAPASSGRVGGASSSVSLTPLGSPLFSSLLSAGLSNFTMAQTTPVQGQDIAAPAATNDAQSRSMNKAAAGLQQPLIITTAELNAMSEADLKSLLASFGETSDELKPDILIAMSPGVPAKDAFEAIKAKFAEFGIDTSKFKPFQAKIVGELPVAATDAPADTTGTLTVDSGDAAIAVNFLLITTGFTPSEMGPVKDLIKSLASSETGTLPTSDETEPLDTTIPPTDNSDEVNASAAMVMMVFVAPIPAPVEMPAADDISFDLATVSAFTQMPVESETEEADWTKKLSDKLSTMSLTDDAASPFDTDTSPFDDEMNAILAPQTAKKSEAGFQGSISTTTDAAKDADASKTVSGEVSAQAVSSMDHGAALSAAALQHVNGDGLLMANGNMLNAQSISQLSNPIFTSGTAIGTHPAIHAVAVLIEKAATGSEKAKQELSVQLDPPELGRMQIQLSMEKDGQMKVHLSAEKQETVSLFQRDAHALKSALESAGIQVDSSSLTFDLASGGDQSFNQLMGNSQDNQSRNGETRSVMGISGGAMEINGADAIETRMDFVANAVTGNVHYSFLA